MAPAAAKPGVGSRLLQEASLPLSEAVLILVGVLLLLLGVLLVPVNLGLLPFSPDGQLGLLLVITSIQIMALGSTPLGAFRRSWGLTAIGLLFAGMGIISCIVPGLLTGVITLLIGVMNILGGAVLLAGQYLPVVRARGADPAEPAPPILRRLFVLQTLLSTVGIVFGISMLAPGIAPGLVIAGILLVNGLLLFALIATLHALSHLSEPAAAP